MKVGNYFYGCVLLLTVVCISYVKGEASIVINCGTGATVGSPYKLSCSITGMNTTGINWFRGLTRIVTCVSIGCVSNDVSKYNVNSTPPTTQQDIEILRVTADDIDQTFSCLDQSADPTDIADIPDSSKCILSKLKNDKNGLSGGEIAGIVIGVLVLLVVVGLCCCVCFVYWIYMCIRPPRPPRNYVPDCIERYKIQG